MINSTYLNFGLRMASVMTFRKLTVRIYRRTELLLTSVCVLAELLVIATSTDDLQFFPTVSHSHV